MQTVTGVGEVTARRLIPLTQVRLPVV
jgi:hypothetical protein